MYTITPTDRKGNAVIVDDDGKQVGTAVARASKTHPGYVTIIASAELDKAVRVPADWVATLDTLSKTS